jgi:hypothetical protein
VRRRATLLLVAVLGLAGCPGRAPLPRPSTPVDPSALLAGLEAQRSAVGSLRARAKLKSGVAGMWAREALVVERPTSVRVDVLSPFGLALALGTDGSRLWVFPPSEGVRYEGRATPENLARFLGAPVAIADLVDILLGVPPRRTPTGPVHVAWEEEAWRLSVPHAAGVQELLVDPESSAVLEAIERGTGATTEVHVRFHDRRDGFPHAIDVHAPAIEVEARLRYADVEYNPTIDGSVFRGPTTVPARPLEVVRLRQ